MASSSSSAHSSIRGWYELTCSDVEDVRARYEPWPDDGVSEERLVLDAVNPLDTNVATALAFTWE